MPQIKTTVIEVRNVAERTKEVFFSIPPNFKFEAGQYISVTLPELANLPLREQFHDFSISSSPDMKGRLSITFRESDSVFKQTLLKSTRKDIIIEGPAGIFTLSKSTKQRVVAIAGGIGITPFKSMVGKDNKPFELIYYNQTPKATVYLSELEGALGSNLHCYYSPPNIEHLISMYAAAPVDLWYIAGPPQMVSTIWRLLKTLKIDDTMVRTEEFSGYEANS